MNERELRLLISQKAVRKVQVGHTITDTYVVTVNDIPLESARKGMRTWKSLETIAAFLRGLGIVEFNVRLNPLKTVETVSTAGNVTG